MQQYVLGFLFDDTRRFVALIEKRGKMFNGKYNGIGGKIESRESSHAAMVREFEEEAGLHVKDWQRFATLKGDTYWMACFCAFVPLKELCSVRTMEQEKVRVFALNRLPGAKVANINWLIPMALSMDAESCAAFDIAEITA